ncbi:MAG: F0F1 ATP synthase subunit A [Bacteroidota bacterium]
MAKETLTKIIAENQGHNQNNQNTGAASEQNVQSSGEHTNTATNEHGKKEMTSQDVFPAVLGHLGDHRELTFFDIHICNLPVIIYDKKEGFHSYSSMESMESKQTFTTVHGHPPIIRKSDMQPVSLDLSITSLLCFEWIAGFLIFSVLAIAARKYKKNPKKAPSGLQNAVEALILYIRDDAIFPNISSKRAAKGLFPYFIALFFFILGCNLLGLVPGGHTATGALAVTGALAITAFFVINITAIRETGIKNWLKHLLGGAPWWLCFIMIPIEIISMFVKPFALTIRLFANMTAGHVVLFSLVGLIFFFNLSSGFTGGLIISPISVAFSLFMYSLDLFVAILQAYIFVILTAVFVGLAIGDHAEEHEEAHSH